MLPSKTRLLCKEIDALLQVFTERGWSPLLINSQDRHASRKDKTLTDRQREILILIGDGLSGKEIATRLSISLKTVWSHKTSIRQKLNLHSIAGLIRYGPHLP
jgi:DNA-binding CsgD family transcriptional regulator